MAQSACLFVELLMIDLTSVPATQNPSSPMIVCTMTMAVVRAATDGGLLSPLREVGWRFRMPWNHPVARSIRLLWLIAARPTLEGDPTVGATQR
jgi:hypothetical protein